MTTFLALAKLTAPLFALIGVGYVLTRFGRWPVAASDTLTRFVFTVAIPTLLFRLMSDFARRSLLTTVLAAVTTPFVLTLCRAPI